MDSYRKRSEGWNLACVFTIRLTTMNVMYICMLRALFLTTMPLPKSPRLQTRHPMPRHAKTPRPMPCTRKKNPLPKERTLALRPRQRLLLHRLLKDLQRQLGLIVRHLVPRAKHPQEAEIVDALERAPFRAVDRVGCQRRGRERGRAGVRDRVGGREAAEPVADPVGVAGPQDDADAALDDGGEGGEEVAGVVARGGEFVVGGVGALGVGGLGADGAGDGGLEEVARVGGRGVRVVARFADVVHVEVV